MYRESLTYKSRKGERFLIPCALLIGKRRRRRGGERDAGTKSAMHLRVRANCACNEELLGLAAAGADSFESVRALRNTRRRARGNNHNGIIWCKRAKKKRDGKSSRTGQRWRKGGRERETAIAKERGKPVTNNLTADSPLRLLLAPPLS